MNSEDKENSETGNTSYKCTLYHFSNMKEKGPEILKDMITFLLTFKNIFSETNTFSVLL